MGPNKKVGQEDLEFGCSDDIGSRCCNLMKQHAIIMLGMENTRKKKDAELKLLQEKEKCDAFLGEYRVSKQSVMLRLGAAARCFCSFFCCFHVQFSSAVFCAQEMLLILTDVIS